MHTCMICGQACYCDMEDHESDQPADCIHVCEDDESDDGGGEPPSDLLADLREAGSGKQPDHLCRLAAAEIEALRTALAIATQRAETQADTIERMTRQGVADGAAIERMHRALRAVQNITEATHVGTGRAHTALSRIAVVVREGMGR